MNRDPNPQVYRDGRGDSGGEIDACRLCGGALHFKFESRILAKYDIGYFQCNACNSLQTERPYWLGEAYSGNTLNLDTGAAQRNMNNLVACLILHKLYDIKHVIDFGGRDGYLCRLLRDYGINCFVVDRYSNPFYAQGFTRPDFETPDLVTAFEVIEHFENPLAQIDELFAGEPRLVLLSTEFYHGQDQTWPYLVPSSGQHVFFYSPAAINFIANRYQYYAVSMGGSILFEKNQGQPCNNILFCQQLFQGWLFQAVKAYLIMQPTPGIAADYMALSQAHFRLTNS